MATLELPERVAVLENQYCKLYNDVAGALLRADTAMGRQDFLAENLVEVRTTVNRIEKTQAQHGKILERHEKILERHGQLLEQQGKTLDRHGEMLQQILERLSSVN
ncbi:MAG TPA: hypothetical protein VFU43_21905 [Streptosporangiaceae bacterium]|nr:hypothetical protein [Streptosporangiaceae bacterium]